MSGQRYKGGLPCWKQRYCREDVLANKSVLRASKFANGESVESTVRGRIFKHMKNHFHFAFCRTPVDSCTVSTPMCCFLFDSTLVYSRGVEKSLEYQRRIHHDVMPTLHFALLQQERTCSLMGSTGNF